MAVREIRLFGDPVLRAQCSEITAIDDGIHSLVDDLLDTVALPGRAGCRGTADRRQPAPSATTSTATSATC